MIAKNKLNSIQSIIFWKQYKNQTFLKNILNLLMKKYIELMKK